MEKLTELFNQALPIIVQAVFTALGLWAGMKITKNKMDFVGVLIIAFACSLIGMQPEPWGLVLSLLFMFLMLWKFAAAKIFPDCLFVVLVSWGIGLSGKHLLIYLAQHIK
ncbi:MAG: hypothetical protein IJS14_14100 [Lentisphaeria bacterium]|nr:hypothetical protein [Lentisphaeria bacterium]